MKLGDDTERLPAHNPLTEALADYIPMSAMPDALFREPLANLDWRAISPELREPLLDLHKQHFLPTAAAVEIASSLQSAIRASLDRRNPLSREEQKRINQLALVNAQAVSGLTPSLSGPASGGTVSAETGMGKTCSICRALEVVAPEQFVVHGRSEACGWSTLTQVLYLRVDFPHNGTRGGFIERVLGAFDELIGTGYSAACRRLRNLDAQLFFVMKALTMHRVGILVLDEMQEDNFELSSLRREFVLFFLSLLNLGIPVLLCGHPKAFTTLNHEAQIVRRFSDIGFFRLPRASASDLSRWGSLIQGLMQFNLCDQITNVGAIADISCDTSAGIPGIFMAQYIEAQRLALRRGGPTAILTCADFERASTSPRIVELKKIVAWAQGTTPPGHGYYDLERASDPDNASSTTTETPRLDDTYRNTPPPTTKRDVGSVVMKLQKKEKHVRNRNAKAAALDKNLLKELAPDDLRVAERRMNILTGLEEQQGSLNLPDLTAKPHR